MRVLVTGARGFVGRQLGATLRARDHTVVEGDRSSNEDALPIDVTDPLAVRAAFELVRPDAVAHLAAQAFVPSSIADPRATFDTNANGTLFVLEAAQAQAESGHPPRVLVVSSAEVYGAQPASAYPLRETTAPLPANPYAASKVAAEALALAYTHSYRLDAVVTRAFNQIGAGQDDRFAVAAFASQLARIAAGDEPVMHVGNIDVSRDFIDVRDVCDAYAALLEGGGAPGEIYNVCSGVPTPMREVLRVLVTIARVPVEIREDPALVRVTDVPLSYGDASKLREATGWAPRIPLAATLRAVYDDACSRVQVTS